MSLDDQLEQGLQALGLALTTEVMARLDQYVGLLAKWNRVYNLTSVRKPQDMIPRHILDSLVVLPYLHGQRLLDVGTGAGLPGIPLALVRPELQVTLLDSNAKKIRFVQQAVAELGIDNVEVVHARVEEYRDASGYDIIISRAYSSTDEFYKQVTPLLAPGGHILAMKGVYPMAEMEVLPAAVVKEVVRLEVPQLNAERHLVIMQPQHAEDS